MRSLSAFPEKVIVFGAIAVALALAGCYSSTDDFRPSVPAEPYMKPLAPISIPIPLDKAGYTVDTTFWVIPPKKPWGHMVGLRVPFTAGDGTRIELMDAHPAKVRVTLHRIEKDGSETKVDLLHVVNMGTRSDENYKLVALPDDVAISKGVRSYSVDERTQPPKVDGAINELEFASVGHLPLGQYRLRLQTLQDNPALKDVPAFLVFDLSPYGK